MNPATQETDIEMPRVELNSITLPKGDRVFALKVKGNCLEGRHILDGDVAIFEHHAEPKNGDVVAVYLEGKSTVKIYAKANGKAFLKDDNPRSSRTFPTGQAMIQGVLKAVVRQPQFRATS